MAEDLSEAFSSLKILSYNVWFREDLEVHKRMKAIGDLIQQHSPDLICFQVSLVTLSCLCINVPLCYNFKLCIHLNFGHLLIRRLLQIYMTFLRHPAGGMYISAQFLVIRLIQDHTFVWW